MTFKKYFENFQIILGTAFFFNQFIGAKLIKENKISKIFIYRKKEPKIGQKVIYREQESNKNLSANVIANEKELIRSQDFRGILKVPINFKGLNVISEADKVPYVNQGLIYGPVLLSFSFKNDSYSIRENWIKYQFQFYK